MKSVLISIKPKDCELIANGSKTIEVRKTRPKIEIPFKCYIYCTHSGVTVKERDRNIYTDFSGKVIGEFVCDGITKLYNIATDKWDYLSGDAHENEKKLCTLGALLTESEVHSYACGKFLYAWHISNLVIYDKPKELHNFHNCSRCKIKYDCDVADWNCYEPHQVQRQKDDWWRRSKRALAEKQKELAELKAVRKVANEQVDRTKEGIFRNLVKEEIGLEMYLKLTKQAEKELEAYNVADLSKHVFTTNKKPVVSVNKL